MWSSLGLPIHGNDPIHHPSKYEAPPPPPNPNIECSLERHSIFEECFSHRGGGVLPLDEDAVMMLVCFLKAIMPNSPFAKMKALEATVDGRQVFVRRTPHLVIVV